MLGKPCRPGEVPGESGFTLLEVLIGIVLVALIAVGVSAISLSGVVTIKDDSRERQQEATTAQWTSLVFARDVQGASAVTDGCPGDGAHLVTLVSSDRDRPRRVEYRTVQAADGTYQLTRAEYAGGIGAGCDDVLVAPRTVVDELHEAPTVTCEMVDGTVGACTTGEPRRVTLQVSRTAAFGFELDGSSRLVDANNAEPPLEVPTFVSLGGDTPLEVGGNSHLRVIGNAYVNRPSSGLPAVRLTGGPGNASDPGSYRLWVSGEFKLQEGATCSGCDQNRANQQPGTFQTRLLDPLRFLPAPDTTGMPVRDNCPVTSGVRVCEPGVYTDEFPPAKGGGGVKDFRLRPGIYVLRGDVKVTNGSLIGEGVLLYNEAGDVKITGADIDLSPPTTGPYSGILFFQARTNSAEFQIVGNAQLASLTGTIYAPASTNVKLGGGDGEMRVGRVIGQNMEVSGNGTVIVDGS